MKLIDADTFRHQMYHEVFEKDSEDQRWDSGCWMRYRLFDKILEEQPAVDAVEIIRCKDCKNSEHWYRDRRRCYLWSENGVSVFDSGFCNYAERRQA